MYAWVHHLCHKLAVAHKWYRILAFWQWSISVRDMWAGILRNQWWWLCTRPSPPLFAQRLVAWINVYALVDACGGCIPGFDELTVPVECVPGCEILWSKAEILMLSSDATFLFLYTYAKSPTGLVDVRARTFRTGRRAHFYHIRWQIFTFQTN